MKSIDKERMMNNLLYVLLVFLFISCSDNDEATKEHSDMGNDEPVEIYSIENLQWIEGSWLDSTTFSFQRPKGSLMEQWKCYPDSISGKGISIRENDTTITSALCIRKVNGGIKYIARPAGEAMIPFSLTFMSDNEAVFENPVNDFPQKIRYLKTAKDSLQVIISGIRPEGERVVTFKMKSVSF
jgi:hypothetical protein